MAPVGHARSPIEAPCCRAEKVCGDARGEDVSDAAQVHPGHREGPRGKWRALGLR